MKRIFALFAIVAIAAAAFAQSTPPDRITLALKSIPVAVPFQDPAPISPWSGSFYFDIRGGTGNAVVMNRIRSLTVNGVPTRFNLEGFAGSTINQEGKAVAGLAITREWTLFDQVFFQAGIGVSISGGNPIGGGILLGAGVRF